MKERRPVLCTGRPPPRNYDDRKSVQIDKATIMVVVLLFKVGRVQLARANLRNPLAIGKMGGGNMWAV